MKKRVLSFVAMVLLFAFAAPAMSAPLFPDVRDDHWAKDAVAALAAKGLLEGYPDGTFKGDRAATRWEVAMIVARLLAKMEQAHATFATKAELEELRKLVNALREELDALGVRVTNLEENVSRLDKRVNELERITFYGYVDTRGVAQTFVNQTRPDNVLLAGAPAYTAAGRGFGLAGAGVPYFNNNGVTPGGVAGSGNGQGGVGSLGGTQLNPAYNGVFPVMDYRSGRPLVNGVGFTMRAVLGLRIRVSDDIDAGAEFSAYTSQGNQNIDAYWGVTAPFLSSQWTANNNLFGVPQGLNNQPFTRMTLDNFWVVHNPSKTKLILGAYSEKNIDKLIYAGQYNPQYFGPRFNDSFGFNVSGKVDIEDAGVFRWEALGTRLADGSNFVGTAAAGVPAPGGYDNWLFGMDVAFEFEGGDVQLNFARVVQEGASGSAQAVGLVQGAGIFASGPTNGMGATNAPSVIPINNNGTGFTPLNWVNPNGFFNSQINAASNGQRVSGVAGNTVDQRPVPGTGAAPGPGINVNDSPLAAGYTGAIGPQAMTMYGANAHYKWDIGDGDTQIYITGHYGHTEYKSNKNSNFTRNGNAFKAEVGANLLEGDLDLTAAYVYTEPTYDPFILSYPGAFGGVWRMPDLNYFNNLYSIHDTSEYPHNRQGVRLAGQYRFNDRRGMVWAKGGFMNQVQTSLYNVRALGGPVNGPVVGFSPGFIDAVFAGYAHPVAYGGGASAFTTASGVAPSAAGFIPLENNRGTYNYFGVGANYKFDDPRVKIELGYERHMYNRNTGLFGGSVASPVGFGPTMTAAGSQNRVNLNIGSLHGQVNWEASDQWMLRAGADYVTIDGHYDPQGNWNAFAMTTGSNNFRNIDSAQIVPFIGFDYDVSANTQWNMDFRYFNTSSGLGAGTNPSVTAGTVGNAVNPFEWNGWQVTTQFRVKF